jgi:hypothetical protein
MIAETEAQRKEREWIENEFDEGILEGYESNLNAPPLWFHNLPVSMLTARQRGYWFGRETRIQEGKV